MDHVSLGYRGKQITAALNGGQTASGQALPYAELMYIWGGKVAVDSITTSALTSRIRMLAVAAGTPGFLIIRLDAFG